MGIDVYSYPPNASKKELEEILFSIGFEMIDSSREQSFFKFLESVEFKSLDGVTAHIRKNTRIDDVHADEEHYLDESCIEDSEWVVYTRTRIWASSFDKDIQNHTLKTIRRKFGGNFYGDFGKNRYIKYEADNSAAVERGIFLVYQRFKEKLDSLNYSLENLIIDQPHCDEHLIQLYNSLIPFLVASLEDFFRKAFIIFLKYEPSCQRKVSNWEPKKISRAEIESLISGEYSIEELIADTYSFQNIKRINDAFNYWVDIDFLSAISKRKRVGKKIYRMSEQLEKIIERRHLFIHKFNFDYTLDRQGLTEYLDSSFLLVNLFIEHLEQNKNISIKKLWPEIVRTFEKMNISYRRG